MALKESLKALGIDTNTLKSVVDGVNRLLIAREQKLALLKRYEQEEGLTIPTELQALIF